MRERVRAAQLAMRQQVSQDIAYSGPTGVVEPAVTASRAGSEIAESDETQNGMRKKRRQRNGASTM